MPFSSYPPEYRPKANLRQALGAGALSPAQVLAELHTLADTVNQTLAFVRALATSDKKLKPAQVNGSVYTLTQQWTATESQSEFLFSNSLVVDPTTATVAVFANGERLPDSSVALSADRFSVSVAREAGDILVADIYENADGVFAKLAATTTGMGASLVAIEDASGKFASATVEGALEEVAIGLDALETALGDVGEYLKRDGSVVWTDHQDAGGNQLKNLAAGVAPDDAVTVAQLTDSVASAASLRVNGSNQMAANLPFGGYKGVNAAAGTAATDVANVGQVMLRNGANAATGDQNLGGFKVLNVAEADEDTGLPTLGQVRSLISAAQALPYSLFASPGAFSGTVPAGANFARVHLVGGGGGGAGGCASTGYGNTGGGGGGGGGAGGTLLARLAVTPGVSYSGTVGAGGAGGAGAAEAGTNGAGVAGGVTTFLVSGGFSYQALGGAGGVSAGARSDTGTAGGLAGGWVSAVGSASALSGIGSGGVGGDGGEDVTNTLPDAGEKGGTFPATMSLPGAGGVGGTTTGPEDMGGGGGGGGSPAVLLPLPEMFPRGGAGGRGANLASGSVGEAAVAGSPGVYGGGGGGGGGDTSAARGGAAGGAGGSGFVYIEWLA